MGAVGQIMPVQANVRDDESVRHAAHGAEGVVNLVAVLAEQGKQRFKSLHVEGARRVAKAAAAAGASAFVHVSALGADAKSTSSYARTKAEGEAAVLAEFPNAVVVRPSLLFGPEDQLFNRFAALAKSAPFMPLIGGNTRFQPIYVGDAAEAVGAALTGAGSAGAIYELGGPEIITMRELLERTMAYAGHQRPLVPVPFLLAKIAAALTNPLPLAARPITVDQVRMLQPDNVVSAAAIQDDRTINALGITQLQAIETVVPPYLERFNPRGQYAHYRS
jgi:NADH dehydrogenase